MKQSAGIMLALLLFGAVGSGWAQEKQDVTVAAALSLKGAFEELALLYEVKHSGDRVQFNFAASGVLQRQIEAGAPIDVFASASSREMDELDRQQLLEVASARPFARNGIVLVVPAEGRAALRSMRELRQAAVQRIAIGNPATVPAGRYAEEVLRHANVWDSVRGKLILCENVRQVLDYTARGEVDAGVVFATDAAGVNGIAVAAAAPAASHSPASYQAAMLRGAEHRAAGRAFIDLLLSAEGQAVLKRRGFLAAP